MADASGAAVRGDAVTGVLLAEAAAAAATLVEINLGAAGDRRERVARPAPRARARERTLSHAEGARQQRSQPR